MTTMNNEDPADTSVHEPRIAGVELPEPVAHRVRGFIRGVPQPWRPYGPICPSRYLAVGADVEAQALYTADQMREAIAAERALLLTDIAALREALDEAATDCELHPLYLGDSATLDDIIRTGGDAAFVTGLARGLREARGSAAEKEQPK